MKYQIKHLPLLLLVVISMAMAGCQQSQSQEIVEDKTPKNIIFLIGDGMSFPQITAAEYEYGPLRMTSLPYNGFVSTYSSDSKVTDSAAGATALASGFKTNNGMLGVLPDGTTPVQSIAHYATELGKTTALLASSRITHATPAGFAIHHDDRGDEFIIAEKFVDSGIDILMGAGFNYFLPETEGGSRPDDRNLISEMQEKGYYYTSTIEGLADLSEHDKIVAFLEGKDLAPAPERGDQMVQLVEVALSKVSQDPDGFFMMIEGSQIDWGGHANEVDHVLAEMKDFDAVISTVVDFAEEDGNTLVVISADHETGGLTMSYGEEAGTFKHEFSTTGHTSLHVPVFSYGPKSELFEGRYDNTEIARKLFSIWGKIIQDRYVDTIN